MKTIFAIHILESIAYTTFRSILVYSRAEGQLALLEKLFLTKIRFAQVDLYGRGHSPKCRLKGLVQVYKVKLMGNSADDQLGNRLPELLRYLGKEGSDIKQAI